MYVTHLRHFTATTGHYHHGDEVKSMVWDNLICYVCEIWVKYSVKGLLERHKQRSDNGTLKFNNHTFFKKIHFNHTDGKCWIFFFENTQKLDNTSSDSQPRSQYKLLVWEHFFHESGLWYLSYIINIYCMFTGHIIGYTYHTYAHCMHIITYCSPSFLCNFLATIFPVHQDIVYEITSNHISFAWLTNLSKPVTLMSLLVVGTGIRCKS